MKLTTHRYLALKLVMHVVAFVVRQMLLWLGNELKLGTNNLIFSRRVRYVSGSDSFDWHVVLSLTDITCAVFTYFCCSTDTGRPPGNCGLRNAVTNVRFVLLSASVRPSCSSVYTFIECLPVPH